MIVQFIATAFTMSNTCSSDHEIMQLPDTVGMLWVYQTSQRNWVAIKVHYGYLRKCLLIWGVPIFSVSGGGDDDDVG